MHAAACQPALYEQLEALPETVVGEILEGRLYTQPRPAPRHLRAADRLNRLIGRVFDDDRPGADGWLIVSEPEIHLVSKVEVEVPELAGWRRARLPALPETAVFETVPDWVCEILSPSTARTDRDIKMPIYARYGVGYAWLVDPDPDVRCLEAYALLDGAWALVDRYALGDRVRAVPFDALAFDLDRLWA